MKSKYYKCVENGSAMCRPCLKNLFRKLKKCPYCPFKNKGEDLVFYQEPKSEISNFWCRIMCKGCGSKGLLSKTPKEVQKDWVIRIREKNHPIINSVFKKISTIFKYKGVNKCCFSQKD